MAKDEIATDGAAPALATFGDAMNAAVIGAGGGIGGALVSALHDVPSVARVFPLSRRPGDDATLRLDLEDEDSISHAARTVGEAAGTLDLVIVATGILHDHEGFAPEKTWRALDGDALARAYRINATGPALVAKHFLPLLPREGKSAFAALSARVGSISDNGLGGWYAYRSSKAALNMLIRTLAVELARKAPDAVCVGLHPGTVDTALSAPFRGAVPDGKLFTPDFAARRLLAVLEGLGPDDTGGVFAWDGARIPA